MRDQRGTSEPEPEPEVAGQRLARVLTVQAAPGGAPGGSSPVLPAISLRRPDGAWRPYQPAGDAGQPAGERDARAGWAAGPAEAEPATGAGASAAAPEPAPGAGRMARLVAVAFDPGRPGLRALAVVAVVVALGAGLLAWWSRPQPEPVAPRLTGTAAAATSTPTAPSVLVVAVSGSVHEPGLVELPPGARVADAIEAAGGLLPEAEIDRLNLARKVSDGELIAVGVDPPPGDPAGGPGADGGSGTPVNLNTAGSEQLQSLPGIGPALAQRIIDHRATQGPFTSVAQLREVPGIGEVRFAELRDRVTV